MSIYRRGASASGLRNTIVMYRDFRRDALPLNQNQRAETEIIEFVDQIVAWRP